VLICTCTIDLQLHSNQTKSSYTYLRDPTLLNYPILVLGQMLKNVTDHRCDQCHMQILQFRSVHMQATRILAFTEVLSVGVITTWF